MCVKRTVQRKEITNHRTFWLTYLPVWLGCSDSRCPETTILGLQPGDVFTHRNVANIVSPTDINTAAVIEYAVDHLRVRHIVLCGHTACGGAAAALAASSNGGRGSKRLGGVLDTWLAPLRALRSVHSEALDAIADDAARAVRLAELNVEAGVRVLMENEVVREAVRDRGLEVHGCLFDIGSGRIRDLGVGTKPKQSIRSGGGGEEVRGTHGQLVFNGNGASMAVR